MIRLGLPTGRYLNQSRAMLRRLSQGRADTTRLSWQGSVDGVDMAVCFAKVHDLPRLVAGGYFDYAVASDDWIAELAPSIPSIAELDWINFSLKIARSCVCTGDSLATISRLATPYPKIAASLFAKQKERIEIIRYSGSVEATIPWLADAILDSVETGRTLENNGLTTVKEVMRCRFRIVRSLHMSESGAIEAAILTAARFACHRQLPP